MKVPPQTSTSCSSYDRCTLGMGKCYSDSDCVKGYLCSNPAVTRRTRNVPGVLVNSKNFNF